MKTLRRILSIAVISITWTASSAHACLPPPPPPPPPVEPELTQMDGETDAAYQSRIGPMMARYKEALAEFKARPTREKAEREAKWLERQQHWFEQAVLVQIVRQTSFNQKGNGFDVRKFRAKFSPEVTLKGSPSGRKFAINGKIYLICGISSTFGLHEGDDKTRYIVFSRQSPVRQDDIIYIVDIKKLTDPTLLGLIEDSKPLL